MPERLEFRYSPQRQLALFITGCALVAVSWFVAMRSADIVYRTVCWFGVAFFALGAIIAVKRMISGGVPFAFELCGDCISYRQLRAPSLDRHQGLCGCEHKRELLLS